VFGGIVRKCSYKECVARLVLMVGVSGGVGCKYSCKECIVRLLLIVTNLDAAR
jgi:phage shock protein PspC (stress-responsive transcriptional regulator)